MRGTASDSSRAAMVLVAHVVVFVLVATIGGTSAYTLPRRAREGGVAAAAPLTAFQRQVMQVKPAVTSTGAWGEMTPEYEYFLDKPLASHIAELVSGSSVLELGAGKGHYTKFLQSSGKVGEITSYDGVPNIAELTDGLVQAADLSVKQVFPIKDWVVCTEVGEHIPAQYEEKLLQNIVRHARVGVLLSWGLLKQTGYGHVNLLTIRQVVDKMANYHFCYLPDSSQRMREGSSFLHFKKNLMVFMPAVPGETCDETVTIKDQVLSKRLEQVNPRIPNRGPHIWYERYDID